MTPKTTQNAPKSKEPKVGSIVGVRMGATLRRARIIEDRGNLGGRGRRLVRIELDPDFDDEEPFRFEVLADRLVDAPA
jgi:hypothetical protein